MAVALTLPLAGVAAQSDCTDDPRHAALARFVGAWEVVSAEGSLEDTVEIRPILGGCSFEGVRREGGEETARSLIYLDPATDRWAERWVARGGATGLFEIEIVGDGFLYSGAMHSRAGDRTPMRISVEPRPEGGFSQRLELSLDDGTTWEPPQITQVRRQGAGVFATLLAPPAPAASPVAAPRTPVPPTPAAPATAPEPAPEPAPPAESQPVAPPAAPAEGAEGGVKVRSERTRYQPPASTVMLESPMMLEIELGPVDALPQGTAWRTTETAVYLMDEVRMPQVSASRRQRRGQVELEVTVNLRTTAMQRRVDIEVELLAGGATVGRERAENIALGKLIGSHDPRVGRPTTLSFPFDEEGFAALFAGGARPSARITVTVR